MITAAYAAQVTLILIARPAAGSTRRSRRTSSSSAPRCSARGARPRPPTSARRGRASRPVSGCGASATCTTRSSSGTSSPSRSRRRPISATSGCTRARSPGWSCCYRARGGGDGRSLWVDGAIGALALTALGSTLLYGPLTDALSGPTGVLTNLAYPLGDLLLLGFVGGAVAMTGWRLHGALGVDRGGARRLRRQRRAVGLHERGRQLRRRVVLRRRLADRCAHDRAGGVAARGADARSRRAGLEHDRARARARRRSASRCSSTTTSPGSTCSRSCSRRRRSSPCSSASR